MVKPRDEILLVILPGPEPVKAIATLKGKFPTIQVIYHDAGSPSGGTVKIEQQISLEIWRNVTILVTIFHLPSTLDEAPNLKLVHLACAGVNHIADTAVYKSPSITITTSSGCASPQIAEWVMMTALVLSWDFPYLHEKQQQRRWLRTSGTGRDAHNVRNLVGQRMGILGYGSIGRQIARIAVAMGMEVLAYTATPKKTPEVKMDHGYVVPGTGDIEGRFPTGWYSGTGTSDLHEFLNQDIDVLVLCVPSTKETVSLLGHDELDILCRSGRKPLLTNISRGAAVDQTALIAALKSGKLRGAALDVQDPEPLPPDNALWNAPNVIIHPHISAGGLTDVYLSRVFEVLSVNMGRQINNRPLLNAVDRSVGY